MDLKTFTGNKGKMALPLERGGGEVPQETGGLRKPAEGWRGFPSCGLYFSLWSLEKKSAIFAYFLVLAFTIPNQFGR